MDLKLEVVVLPVSDVDKSKAFYEQAGFNADVDTQPNENFRIVQLTPPGSACSIIIGKGLTTATPGSAQATTLVVTDIEEARANLLGRGIDVSDFFHFGPGGQQPGLDPERQEYGSFVSFTDPDENSWLVQEKRG
ncbi:MAG TPA: VOC family protein [Acidimicrobiia bacterium]|jgi:catechol 2,3-dioxygenase-like lactoylglutathione lyase family enzyme